MNIPLSEWSGGGATDRLRETVATYSDATSKQTEAMLRLTRQLVALTWVLVLGLAIQIVVALA